MRASAFWLSLALVFMIPWENAITVAEFGTMTRIIGIFMAVAWLGSVLATRRYRPPHPFHLCMVLFIIWNIISIYWSVGIDETLTHISTYIQIGVLAWILWDLYTKPSHLRAALEAYILGAYVAIASTIFHYLSGQEIHIYQPGRYAGAGLQVNELGIILSLGLPLAWHLATSQGIGFYNHILRLLNYAYIPISLFVITLTGTRTSFFTVAPAIFYIAGTANRLKPLYRILLFAAFVGALFAFRPNIPQPTLDRLFTTADSIAARDLGGRVDLWRRAIMVFSEHPVLGVGSGALHADSQLGVAAHNTFLSVLAELGLIGFTLFVAMLAMAVYQAGNQPKPLSVLWLTVLAIWAIGASTLTWEFSKPTWLFLSLLLVSAKMFRHCDGFMEDPMPSVEPPIQLTQKYV